MLSFTKTLEYQLDHNACRKYYQNKTTDGECRKIDEMRHLDFLAHRYRKD